MMTIDNDVFEEEKINPSCLEERFANCINLEHYRFKLVLLRFDYIDELEGFSVNCF